MNFKEHGVSVVLIEWTIKEWCIKFLLLNLKEVGQEADPNPDGWDCVFGDIRKCKIRNWEKRSKKK
jgi:hypothetical protein